MTLRPPFLFARLLGLHPEIFSADGKILLFSRPRPARPDAGDTKELPYQIFKLTNKNPPA